MDPAILSALAQSLAGQAAPGGADSAALNALVQLVGTMMSNAEDDDDEHVEDEAQLAKRRQRAWKKLARIHRTMTLMSKRNAFVAGALGACECWGADVSCARCRGTGAPGAFELVPAAFEMLIVPLLRRRGEMLRDRLDREQAVGTSSGAAVH